MGILVGFAPWIVYWVLVGNVAFATAVLVALAIAVVSFVIRRISGAPGHTLEIGSVATFSVLTILTFTLSHSFKERWMLPLSIAGIFLVALIGVLIGKPFVREYTEAGQPGDVVKTELFGRITTLWTWLWVAVFAGMTVSSSIPPIVQGDATILGTETPLSFICYWVVPFSLFGVAALASQILADRMIPGEEVVRKTSFVAFAEAEIDQLYYLAQEHANREVGAGKEAYNVTVGSKGVPLVGDETRESWPSTYKVRDKRR